MSLVRPQVLVESTHARTSKRREESKNIHCGGGGGGVPHHKKPAINSDKMCLQTGVEGGWGWGSWSPINKVSGGLPAMRPNHGDGP